MDSEKGLGKFSVIKVMVCVLGLVGLGLVLFGGKKLPGNNSTKIDTSGWKTFRDEMYGVEFKYPADWVSKNGLFNIHSPDYKADVGYNGGDFPQTIILKGASLSVKIDPDTSTYAMDNFIQANKSDGAKNSVILIEGKEALLVEFENRPAGYMGHLMFLRPYVNDGQIVLTFTLSTSKTERKVYAGLLKQIASTFKTFPIDSKVITDDCNDKNKYINEKMKSGCIEYVAERTKNKDLCSQVTQPKSYCLYLKSVGDNNLADCTKIESMILSVDCFKEISQKQKMGVEICKQLGNEESKRLCRNAFGEN